MKKINKVLMMISLMISILTIGMIVKNDVNSNSHHSQEEQIEETIPTALVPVINSVEVERKEYNKNDLNITIDFEANGTLTEDSYIEIWDEDGWIDLELTTGGSSWQSGVPIPMIDSSYNIELEDECKIKVSLTNENGTTIDESTFILHLLNSFEISLATDNKIRIDYDSDVEVIYKLYEYGTNIVLETFEENKYGPNTHTFHQSTKPQTQYTVIAKSNSGGLLGGHAISRTIYIPPPTFVDPIVNLEVTKTNNIFGTNNQAIIKLNLNIIQKRGHQVSSIKVRFDNLEEESFTFPGNWNELEFEATHEFVNVDDGMHNIEIVIQLYNSESVEIVLTEQIEITTDENTIPIADLNNSTVENPTLNKDGTHTYKIDSIKTRLTTAVGDFEPSLITGTDFKYEIVTNNQKSLVPIVSGQVDYNNQTGIFTLNEQITIDSTIVESGYLIILTGVEYKQTPVGDIHVKDILPLSDDLDKPLSDGAIAGIVIGSIAGVALLGVSGYWVYNKQDNK